MNILVIDAQGGGLGKQLITALKKNFPDMDITAVGTNTMATGVMLKAGTSHAATGENAVVVGCRKADIIIGPLAIVIADSMFGEITPSWLWPSRKAMPRGYLSPSIIATTSSWASMTTM